MRLQLAGVYAARWGESSRLWRDKTRLRRKLQPQTANRQPQTATANRQPTINDKRTMLPRKQLSKEQALQKAKHYCAYQERSHKEVKEKLYSFGLYKAQVEELLSQLIEENYLNEERFAIQFAGGKFRMKQWGKVKIRYELKQRQVSEYNIRKALKELEDEPYLTTLEKLAEKRWTSVKADHSNRFTRLAKTTDFLLQKGFEPELINKVVGRLL